MRDYPQKAVLALLRAYQWLVSPLLGPACRYLPTCSEYAREAVERHGVLRGGVMGAARVLRCHPLAGSGYDPVPVDRRPPTRSAPHAGAGNEMIAGSAHPAIERETIA